MVRILAVNGSYREGGAIDQAIEVAAHAVREFGANAEVVYLRDTPIELCANCRHCTQTPGEGPEQEAFRGMHSGVIHLACTHQCDPTPNRKSLSDT